MKTTTFKAVAARITTVVEFNEDFTNGTGYFDHAVNHDFGLAVGESCKFVDPNGRTVLVHATFYGNVVAFERFKPTEGAETLVVAGNVPSAILDFTPGSAWSDDELLSVFGEPGCNNLGQRLDHLLTATILRLRKLQKESGVADDNLLSRNLAGTDRPIYIKRREA